VYSTFIFTENHKPQGIRQAKRDSADEDHELRVRAPFPNGLIFCSWPTLACAAVAPVLTAQQRSKHPEKIV
jgi:hypothetical protein